MSNGEITTDIERFIHDNINSVEQLEVLLLIAAPPQKEWSAGEVSEKIYRQPDSVASRLEDFRDRGILSVRKESLLLYRYVPSAQLDVVIRGLERAYEVRRDAVIRLIFTRPPDALRVFSDAFRIRRDS